MKKAFAFQSKRHCQDPHTQKMDARFMGAIHANASIDRIKTQNLSLPSIHHPITNSKGHEILVDVSVQVQIMRRSLEEDATSTVYRAAGMLKEEKSNWNTTTNKSCKKMESKKTKSKNNVPTRRPKRTKDPTPVPTSHPPLQYIAETPLRPPFPPPLRRIPVPSNSIAPHAYHISSVYTTIY